MTQPQEAKILIIEDDSFLAELCSKKIEKSGLEPRIAEDGEKGLKLLEEWKPDLVLLDIMLPGIDGFEVLDRIRKLQDTTLAKIPIILLSNFGQEENVQRGISLGANDYLVKANFTTEEIVNKIRALLGKHAS